MFLLHMFVPTCPTKPKSYLELCVKASKEIKTSRRDVILHVTHKKIIFLVEEGDCERDMGGGGQCTAVSLHVNFLLKLTKASDKEMEKNNSQA